VQHTRQHVEDAYAIQAKHEASSSSRTSFESFKQPLHFLVTHVVNRPLV
jgi:hypothetical protein